jgi:hypothetical protein
MLPTSDHVVVMSMVLLLSQQGLIILATVIWFIRFTLKVGWCNFYNIVKCGRWLPTFWRNILAAHQPEDQCSIFLPNYKNYSKNLQCCEDPKPHISVFLWDASCIKNKPYCSEKPLEIVLNLFINNRKNSVYILLCWISDGHNTVLYL